MKHTYNLIRSRMTVQSYCQIREHNYEMSGQIIPMREVIPARLEKEESTENLRQRTAVSNSTPAGVSHAQDEVSKLACGKRTGEEIEAEIIALRDFSLEVNHLNFGRLFRELQRKHARKRTGKFWRRVEELGFSKTTAQRWMAEYDREVGHKGKTARRGSFPLEASDAVGVTKKIDGKGLSSRPDEITQISLNLTSEERKQFVDAWESIGQEAAQRLVFEAVLGARKRRTTNDNLRPDGLAA